MIIVNYDNSTRLYMPQWSNWLRHLFWNSTRLLAFWYAKNSVQLLWLCIVIIISI